MTLMAVQAAKYLCILLLMVYTISSFEVLSVNKRSRQVVRYRFHNILIFCIQLLLNMSLILQRPQMKYAWFYVAQLAFFLLFLLIHRTLYRDSNLLVLNHMFLFLAVGFVVLARLDFDRAQKQFFFACGASVIALLIPYISTKIKVTKVLAVVFGILGLGLLILVYVRGQMVYGANLSLQIGPIAIQPSEFVKVSFVLLIAMMFRNKKSFGRVVLVTIVAAVHVAVLMISTDLGGALIYFMTYLFMLYAATHTLWYSAVGLGLGSVAAYGAYRMFSHVQVRVLSWMDPWSVIDNEGYQIAQSLFAILSGGWFGTGLDEGRPDLIPVVEKDFTFSAIVEEFGGIFALCLLLICLCMILSMLMIAVRMTNQFYKLVAVGLASLYGVQVFLTIGGVIKLIPHTGVTLPLVSYGGSSLTSTFIVLALIQGLTVLWKKNSREQRREKKLARSKSGRGHAPILAYEDMEEQDLEETNRNVEVFGISYLHASGFLVLAIYFVCLLASPKEDILNNPYNRVRLQENAATTVRGDIVDRDGNVLAETKQEGDVWKRSYPFANMFSHIIGYTGSGSAGVESLANFWLLQEDTDVWKTILCDLSGKKQKGYQVSTTLSLKMQQAAYDALGDHQGAVVALDARTGEVLALVSKPDFDPNHIEDVLQNLNRQSDTFLLNRALQGTYPPGSSFKIITMLAYMRQYPDTWQTFVFECDGHLEIGEEVIRCSEEAAHGTVGFTEALAHSCNGYFAALAMRVSPEIFNETVDTLLFNQTIQGDLSLRKSTCYMSAEQSDMQRAILGIGQGATLITPMHSALITAAVVNGGEMPAVSYVQRVVAQDGTVEKTFEGTQLAQVMTPEEAEVLKRAMIGTVENGTAYLAASDSYVSGGKTGSAQYMSQSMETHAIYTGFGERDGRTVVVAVFVEGGGSGGLVAAPIAKQVLDAYFAK